MISNSDIYQIHQIFEKARTRNDQSEIMRLCETLAGDILDGNYRNILMLTEYANALTMQQYIEPRIAMEFFAAGGALAYAEMASDSLRNQGGEIFYRPWIPYHPTIFIPLTDCS